MSNFLFWERYQAAELQTAFALASHTGAAGLVVAAARGNLEEAKRLLCSGVDARCHDNEAILWASLFGHAEMVSLLLDAGADAGANSSELLAAPALFGDLRMVSLLVEAGADLHAGGERALSAAAFKGHLPVVAYLASKGANVRNPKILRDAVFNGHAETVEFLLDCGAELGVDNLAMYTAAGRGQCEIIDILHRFGASLEKGPGGDTPLRAASGGGHARAVKCLLAKGAPVRNAGWAVIDAASGGHAEVVRILLKAGAPAHDENYLAMHVAAEKGFDDIVKALRKVSPPPVLEGLPPNGTSRYPDLVSLIRNGFRVFDDPD